MEEQPAKRAKLGGFTTSSSIITTQGAVGSSVLSNAEYPAMHAHYDNPTVNASISPIVQNIMMDTSGYIQFIKTLAEDVQALAMTTAGEINMHYHCGISIPATYDKQKNLYTYSDSGTKMIIFSEPPVKIKKNLYQVSRVVGGMVSLTSDFLKGEFQIEPTNLSNPIKPGCYKSSNNMSMVYHQPDSDGKHKVNLQLMQAL
jgi:hypothetical protein